MLRVFEAFAGYGSQRMALRNIGIEFEVVGISEIDGDVIQSYAAIHSDFLEKREHIDNYVPENKEEMITYLEEINVPLNYKTFENRAKKLRLPKLKDMYLANKLINNYGDIQRIDPTTLPDFDLFTYSFPCQDISVAGYQCGLNEDSGTRSSLLWECCKIIETKRPKFLMMENVNKIAKYIIDLFSKNNMPINELVLQKVAYKIKMNLGQDHPLYEELPYYWYCYGPFSEPMRNSFNTLKPTLTPVNNSFLNNNINTKNITPISVYDYPEIENIVLNLISKGDYVYSTLSEEIYKEYAPLDILHTFKYGIFNPTEYDEPEIDE